MYSVYSLTDGAIGDIDATVNIFDDALALYESVIGYELITRDKLGADYTETTVHLYDSALGVMLAESCIVGGN